MPNATRSTYTVIELGPDGAPVRNYKAVITPYSAGEAPPGWQPPVGGGEPGIPTFPIAGYPDFPYPSQPIYRPGYPGGERPPSFRPPGSGGGEPGIPTFPIAGYPDFPYPSQPIYRPGYPGGERPPSFPPVGGGGGGGPSPGPGYSATVIPLPPTDPPTPPPAGMPPTSTQVLIWFGPGTMPAAAWVAPYPSTGPVPPAEGGGAPPATPQSIG